MTVYAQWSLRSAYKMTLCAQWSLRSGCTMTVYAQRRLRSAYKMTVYAQWSIRSAYKMTVYAKWSLRSAYRMFVCLCWGLTSQSTIFQSCRDGAIASWVINQYFWGVKCLAQGHNTAAVGFEPPTSRSGVRHSTPEPLRSPPTEWHCMPSEASDQPVLLSSLIWVLAVHITFLTQRAPSEDFDQTADAEADLSYFWLHIPYLF